MQVASVTARLVEAGCVAAADEAAELLDAAPDRATLDAWVERRAHGEPLAWITGRVVFCGRVVHVDPGVFVPRPQTEELVRRAARLLAGGRAADLCTGSGAVAALLSEQPGAWVVAVDVDPRAVTCARRNGVAAIVADLAAPLASRAFDVVTAVAPYVPTDALGLLPRDVVDHEPRRALHGGVDGLDVLRRVVHDASRILRPGGWLLVEIGGDQDAALAPVLEAAGFAGWASWADEDGDVRGLVAQLR